MCKVPNEKLNFPEALTDEELCRLVAEGNRQAGEILAARYIRLVRTCARPYFLAGGDSEDLIQEGMVGLLAAIRETIWAKPREHHFNDSSMPATRGMYRIGG